MRQKRQSIAAILCVSLVLLILLSSIAQSAIISTTTKHSLAASYATDCTQITNAYSLAVANKISEYMNQMRYYTDADVVQAGTTEQVVTWLREHTGNRKTYFSSILYAATDGIAYTDIGTTEDIRQQQFFTEIVARGKTDYVDNPSASGGSGVFHIARAAKRNGEVIGVFAATVPLDTIQNMVRYVRLGESAQAWVIADDGMVIAASDDQHSLRLNLLSTPEASVSSLMRQAVDGGIGSGWVKGLGGSKGRSFVTYTPVANTPWTFALSMAESQIYATSRSLNLAVIIIAVVTTALLIVAVLAMTGAFLRPLGVVEKTINGIASGNADLTQRITLDSRTEIGSVVDGFNRFTDKLQSIIREMQGSKDDLRSYGERLSKMVQENAAFLSEMQVNIREVDGEVATQHSKVSSTVDAVSRISASVEDLGGQIKRQTDIIRQSSAAVTQMIGSIDGVSDSVRRMVGEFDVLQASVDEGIAGQNAVNAQIQQIEQQSKMLNEANKVISSIASQTNLLAMNAAIEAAHAGTAGQGFAVVADEIRKLSETSSAQSKNIGQQLKGIMRLITNVVLASASSDKTFSALMEKIRETGSMMHGVEMALEEQASGSKQISRNLTDMDGATAGVKSASDAVDDARREIIGDVDGLKQSSDTVKVLVGKMEGNVRHIEEDDNSLLNLVTSISDSIYRIGNQIDQFKV